LPWHPKVVHSSHLALRFYRSDGWTRAELEACLLPSEFPAEIDDSEFRRDLPDCAYFSKGRGAWDFGKLMPLVLRIVRYSDSPSVQEQTDEEYARHIDR